MPDAEPDLLTSIVTISEHITARETSKLPRIPNGFVQETRQAHAKAHGTIPIQHRTRVGDVISVIPRVQIPPIPAARKSEFHAQAVSTVLVNVRLAGHAVTHERRLGCRRVVETIEAESSAREKVLRIVGRDMPLRLFDIGRDKGKRAKCRITREHLEAGRECLDGTFLVVSVKEVISRLSCQLERGSNKTRRHLLLTRAFHQSA